MLVLGNSTPAYLSAPRLRTFAHLTTPYLILYEQDQDLCLCMLGTVLDLKILGRYVGVGKGSLILGSSLTKPPPKEQVDKHFLWTRMHSAKVGSFHIPCIQQISSATGPAGTALKQGTRLQGSASIGACWPFLRKPRSSKPLP